MAADRPLSDLLLEALGDEDQVGASTEDSAMVLTLTRPMVLVQLRWKDGGAILASVTLPGESYDAPMGTELDADKEEEIRAWLAGEHSAWQPLGDR